VLPLACIHKLNADNVDALLASGTCCVVISCSD